MVGTGAGNKGQGQAAGQGQGPEPEPLNQGQDQDQGDTRPGQELDRPPPKANQTNRISQQKHPRISRIHTYTYTYLGEACNCIPYADKRSTEYKSKQAAATVPNNGQWGVNQKCMDRSRAADGPNGQSGSEGNLREDEKRGRTDGREGKGREWTAAHASISSTNQPTSQRTDSVAGPGEGSNGNSSSTTPAQTHNSREREREREQQ